MGKHWSERPSPCNACGASFRSALAEARHRHNFPHLCKRNAAFKAFMEEHHGKQA